MVLTQATRPSADKVFGVVRDALAVILAVSAQSIEAESSLADLGADSLVRIELAEIVEQQLAAYLPDLHIPDADLASMQTVGDAVAVVLAHS